MKELILASKSPRRTEILSQFDIPHRVVPSESEETYDPTLPVEKIVEEIAAGKAQDVAKNFPDDVVLGVDTIVVLNNEILGKPKDLSEAHRMLKKLSGQTHRVISGICLIYPGNFIEKFHDITQVTFSSMSDEDIENYIHSESVLDKAGSYAAQGEKAWFIKGMSGSYYNVIGLPIEKIIPKIRK